MANFGKRMVAEDLIKQIGQGGGSTYTAGDGIAISEEDVISVDNTVALKSDLSDYAKTADLATVATTGDYDDLTDKPDLTDYTKTKDYSLIPKCPNPVTMGPTSATTEAVQAWMKTLPTIIGRSGSAGVEALETLGFTNVINLNIGDYIELQGYFNLVIESSSSPYGIQDIVTFTCENRTGTNSLVNRENINTVTAFKAANQDIVVNDARNRGINTTLAGITNPVSGNTGVTVYSIAPSPAFTLTLGIASNRAPIKDVTFGFYTDYNNAGLATGTNYRDQAKLPTTDGTYVLKVTVTNGVPTLSWVLDQE